MKHFPIIMGLVRRACFALAVLMSLAGNPVTSAAFENLHGSAHLMGMDTSQDSSRVRSLDQQYMMNYSRSLLPYVSVHLTLTYHDLQTFQKVGADGWHGELMPSGNLNWVNPFFNVGANYRYRQVRDLESVSNSHSQGAGVYFKTNFRLIPQSTIMYDWDRNVINAGLQPTDNEQKRFQYTTNYSYKRARTYYTYSNQQYNNLTNDVRQNLLQHTFRFDYANNFLKNRLLFSSNYLFNYTHRRLESNQPLQPLTQIPAVTGLYAQDPNPALGALDTLMTLIDGNVFQPTTINLGGAFLNQNIGFDLSLARMISVMYLYTDRVCDPAMVWSVYSSDDNLTWTLLAGGVGSLFNAVLNRYEITFTAATARYFKIVNSTVDEKPEVFVTEIQAFISSQDLGSSPDRTRNHRVNSNISYQFNPKWRVGVDGVYGNQEEEATGQQRQDASIAGTVTYQPSDKVSSVGRYQRGLTDYKTGLLSSQGSEVYSLILLVKPLQTVETSLSGSQLQTWQNQVRSQLVHSILAHLSAQLIPGLSAITEAGFSRSQRPVAASTLLTDTWTYRLSGDATPYQSLNVIGAYTMQIYNSNQSYANGRRDAVDINLTYRLTPALFFRGGVTYGQEDGGNDLVQDYSLSWELTQRISANANTRFQNSTSSNNVGYDTRTLNLQMAYLLSDRVNINAGYSHNRISSTVIEENSSYQVGLNASF